MATHTLAILVEALGTAKASAQLKGVDKAVSNIGASAGKGLRTAAGNLAKIGAVGAGIAAGLTIKGIHDGIDSLATLESAVTSVNGAIAAMGEQGQVTGQQVATWSNEIEASVHAAFDDKDITQATANLIRYGRVTPKNLRPAMVVMTDLAAKTGDVQSASSLLAKALADPAKAGGKLARVGIVLSKADQDRIKQLVKEGKVTDAQAFLLDKLSKATKGAADASQGPYAKAMSTLKDTTEDAERALAVGFLPVIEKASEWLKTKLADPKVQKSLQDIGQGLADAADKGLAFVEGIPWDKVVDGLRTAAGFAKGLIDAFTSMPPEVQGTIIALAGLNKLSGGAIGSIVGDLGKGLIKGVLGMTAGVVNIKAGVVNGGGGLGGGVGSGESTSKLGQAANIVSKVLIVGMVAEVAQQLSPSINQAGIDIHNALGLPKFPDWTNPANVDWPFGSRNTPTILPEVFGGNGLLGGQGKSGPVGTASNQRPVGEHANFASNKAAPVVPTLKELKASLAQTIKQEEAASRHGNKQALATLGAKEDRLKAQISSLQAVAADKAKQQASISAEDRIHAAAQAGTTATQVGTSGTTSAVNVARTSIVSAITGFRIPAPIVTVTVGPGSVTKSVTRQNRAGPANGSAGGGSGTGQGRIPG